ncbi:MAG: hypothetical protein WCL06_11575 [Bacteroidota bacterium]
MKKSFLLLFLFSLLIIVASCKKDQTTTPPDDTYVPIKPVTSTSLAGFGHNSGIPVGTNWTFPASIKVVGHILGGNPGKEAYAGDKNYESWLSYFSNQPKTTWETHGLGVFVNLYMKLHNTSANPTTFIFPAGLVFCNDSSTDSTVLDTAQTGVIVVPDTITIPGGDTLNLCLKSFCTNASRHAPSYFSIYEPKVVSINDQMVRFIAALRGKSTLASHESDILGYIWKFTGGTPLTEADYATIASWQ